MTTLHGFDLLDDRTLPEISSRVRHYRHLKTGAELLSVENDDDNKSFGVALQTPAPDDSGLPHILEHSVLAGSRSYPTKDPFAEMIKTSLASFINAMTFPDMTIYPVASTNIQDFYNLMDVYLDAVFFPLIPEKTFQQEGWHYELSADGQGLVYNGIVFNEMKGYMSSAEIVMDSLIPTTLLPDTPYANDSGGDPSAIPSLTYEQFRRYHATYYHPSNARFFFYGDDAPEERLRRIDAVISQFERQPVVNPFDRQARFSTPRSLTKRVDAGEATETDNKALVTINWLLGDVTDQREMMAMALLNNMLIGTSAAPLTVALQESGLGEDLMGSGLSSYTREATFSVGMKGIFAQDAAAVEALILETLGDLADNGIDTETIAAAINTVEFDLRERNTGRLPRGLAVFMGMLPVWMHGGDPVEALAFEADLNAVKAAYADNPQYFEGLIGRWLLQNPHRTTVLLTPDPQVKAERDAAEQAQLQAANAPLSEADRAAIAADVKALKARQEAVDTPEDLARLPRLQLNDLDRAIKTVPTETLDLDGVPLLYHDLGTSGVVYLDLTFDLQTLPIEYVPYVSLFSKALTELGTTTQDFVSFQNRIGAQTGGISVSEMAQLTFGTRQPVVHLVLRAKAMVGQTNAMLDIVRDVLLNVNFDNRERFRQMILEEKAQTEAYLGLYGQSLSGSRLRGHFDVAGWFNEQNNGVSQLFFLRDLAMHLDNQWEQILHTFTTMRDLVINRASLIVNLTTDQRHVDTILPVLRDFAARMPTRDLPRHQWDYRPTPLHEGLAVITQVNFVGKAANFMELGYAMHGSQYVILNQFNLTYMYNKIRLQGGAYGGSLNLNPISGVGAFLSWQDPNVVETLAAYDAAALHLRTLDLSQSELEKAIIGAVGRVDGYQLPDAKGMSALINYLIAYPDTVRQQRRDELFSTSLREFRMFADVLEQVARSGSVVVVGSADKLEQASERLSTPLTITKVQ